MVGDERDNTQEKSKEPDRGLMNAAWSLSRLSSMI